MRKTYDWLLIIGIMLVNVIAIYVCVKLGSSFQNVALFFQERQTVTFLSALQLALVSALSMFIYMIKRLLNKENIQNLRMSRIWLISVFVFAFAAIDEYFMLHEGIDGDIATFFFNTKENPHLDGLTLALYGILAVFLFFKFKYEILKHKKAVFLFCACGFFFLLSICLDLRSIDPVKIIVEESSKLLAVGFLFSGYLTILSDIIRELDRKLNG